MLLSSPSVCWRPSSVCVVAVLNGGGGVCCGVPRLWAGRLCVVLFPLRCLASPLCCLLWVEKCGGEVWWWNRVPLCSPCVAPVLHCVCCHSIVGLGLCFNVRVVSLWNVGGGLCSGRRAVGGGVFVAVHSSLSFLLSFFPFVLVFGVVRAQLCEHARYPRTPLRLSCCLVLSSLLLHCFSLLSAFLVGVEWRGGYHVSLCCVGMTAIGSLSLSFSFFW